MTKSLQQSPETQTYDFPGLDATTFQIQNHNRLLGSYAGAVGLKTGFTTLSGHTLVAAAERNGVQLVAVVLGSEDRAEPAASALFDWAFALPGDAASVGQLVTPTEVAAAVQAHDSARSAASVPQEAATAGGDGSQPATSRSAWVWPAGALVAVLVAVLTVWRSRVRRARTSAAVARPGPRRARRG